MNWIAPIIDKDQEKDNWVCVNIKKKEEEKILSSNEYFIRKTISVSNISNKWIKEANKVLIKKLYTSDLEKEFLELAGKWKRETGIYSTMLHKTMNDNYLDIIAKGEKVIPFILRELEREPNHWFVALKHLAQFDPVKKEDVGNIEKMRKAWLEWGRKEKLI